MTMPVAATPDPGLDYHFKLNIDSDGTPSLIAGVTQQTTEKIALTAIVKVLDAAKEAAFYQSMMMGMAAMQDPAVPLDPIGIPQLVHQAEASAFGAAGAATAVAESAVQSKLDEMQKLANRYVYTEQVAHPAKEAANVSDQAKKDSQEFQAKLKAIFGALPDEIAKLDPVFQIDYKTKLWNDALRLITDAYVIQDQESKKSVIAGLSDLYTAVKGLGLSDSSSPVYNRLIDILTKAYNNAYLTNVGDLIDDQNKSNWYLWMNNLAKEIFQSPKFMKNGIDINLKGEYLWFPVSFSTAGSGSVTFEVKAYSDIFVCLSENAVQSRETPNKIYEIVIGKWDNKVTAIHRKSLGDAIVEFDHAKIPDLSPDPVDFKKYWININNGVISCGVGDLGKNKLWEYKDPYPPLPVQWVGFSNWLSINTYRNITVGGAV
jgi:hypothetical protein